MASSNIKLFDENKGNMLTDTEFNISSQRLNGLQTGVASSQLQNKAMYQASLVAYAIAQIMLQNGLNANDTDAVSTFVANLSGTMLQKVYDIASTAEAQAGAATGKWMSPALVKAAFDYRKANTSEAQNATDDTKWMSPALVKAFFNYMEASTSEAQAGTNNTKWMSPALVKAAIDTLAAKAQNILSNGTKTLLGLGANAVPDDAFQQIKTLIDSKAIVQTGSYVGAGTYGGGSPNSLTFNFVPKLVIIKDTDRTDIGFFVYNLNTYSIYNGGSYSAPGNYSQSNNTISWYFSDSSFNERPRMQLNGQGSTYTWVAIG